MSLYYLNNLFLEILNNNLLFYFILIPFIGILFLFFNPKKNMAKISFLISLVIFSYSLFIFINFDKLLYQINWLFHFSSKFLVTNSLVICFGIDGISMYFIILTTFIFPLCILSNWKNILNDKVWYFSYLLLIEGFLIIAFLTFDIFYFFIFFEALLIPLFLIIGNWGTRERRVRAIYLFLIYTLLGSIFMLFSIIIFLQYTKSTSILVFFFFCNFNICRQFLFFLFFFIGLSIKVPMFPFYIWLPEAHVEAPTVGSVILASLILKLGAYGIIRLLLPLFPIASLFFTPFIFSLAILSIIFSSFSAIRQIDIKRIIAYTSIAHMNLGIVGLFSFNIYGLEGSLFLMVAHGLTSASLFFLVGVLYDRYHTRLLFYFGGLSESMPMFSTFFFFATLSNMGFPLTSNFMGEFISLVGIFDFNIFVAILSSLGIILSSIYSIWFFARLIFGVSKNNYIKKFVDLTKREFNVLLPLLFFSLLLGIYPNLLLDVSYISIRFLYYLINSNL